MAVRRGKSKPVAVDPRGRARARGPDARTPRRPGSGVGVVIVIAALALAACTGRPPESGFPTPGDDGTVTPTIPTTEPGSPAPTPSSAPTSAAAPERPAAMDRTDAEGAIAAATYFISLYSYVYATNDLRAWALMSDPDCVFCQSVQDDIAGISARGEHSEGGAILPVGAPTAVEGSGPTTYEVNFSITQAPIRTFDQAGTIVDERPQQSGIIAIALETRQPGQWRTTGVNTELAK